MKRALLSILVAGVFLSTPAGAQGVQPGSQEAAAAACAAREAFEDTLPWTFRGVTYPNKRYFVENFKCGAHKYKFDKQSDEEKGLAAGKGKPRRWGRRHPRGRRRDQRLLPRDHQRNRGGQRLGSADRRPDSRAEMPPTRTRAGRSTAS